MTRMRRVRVTRPARLGFAALVVILLAAVGIFLAVKVLRGAGGYQIGVRFPQAAGVAPGAQVFLNGVTIGGVSKVQILPDTRVELIINIYRDTSIPKTAKFSVQTALTGSPIVAISVPSSASTAEIWPKRILPIEQQPVGTPPLSLEMFMRQSRSLGDRAYAVLAKARPYGKPLMTHLQHARENGAATMENLQSALPTMMSSLQSTVTRAKANVAHAQTALRDRDQPKLAAIADAFERSAADMEKTTASLNALKRDPRIHANLRDASAQLRAVTNTMAQLSHDMEMISGNPQTKAQLKDAGARLRAVLHKL